MLPVVDLAAPAETAAQALGRACEEIGFATVVGHGVPEAVRTAARQAAIGFFARPDAEKAQVARPRGRYRGYIAPLAFSQDRDSGALILYEAFIAGADYREEDAAVRDTGGLLAPNRWPARPAGFREAVLAYWLAVAALGERLLELFALALGREPDALLRQFRQPLSNLSLLHYPPSPAGARPANARPHRDTNAVTVLLPDPIGGLEVQRRDGSWFAVPAQEGFVINVGNMLELWSGGRFRSTMHRVHPPEGRDRYSLAYFAAPDAACEVAPLDGSGAPGETLNAGRDLAAFVAQFDGGPPKY